jgi:hypothetical protein
MKLQFISQQHVQEAIKFLAGKGHLPYTDASGNPSHKLMGAAWAALHGGYRGNKYEGKGKDAALAKLKAVYKSEKMDTPEESFSLIGDFFQESLAGSDSYSSIQSSVMCAINAKIKAAIDMDCDNDGPADAGFCSGCGCNCGSSYGCSCCDDCSCTYPQMAWCMDLFPGQIVFSMEGELFQVDYSIASDGGVTLGDPMKVETGYLPVGGTAAKESHRMMACAATQMQESDYDSATGKLTLTVISPGLNKSKSRCYPAEMLKRDYAVFENAKMFANHQTDAQAKQQPEGDVNNWVAQISKVWPEADGRIRATAAVIDPMFKEKLDLLKSQGMLHEMGVSIRAIGEANEGEVEGVTTNVVESLIAARSVDFVTYAGAGGQIEAMESAMEDNEIDVDLVTEANLRKRRPDLIQLVETRVSEKIMKSLEQQLQESQAQLATAIKSKTELATELKETQTRAAKAATKAAQSQEEQLTESQTEVATLTKANADLALKFQEQQTAAAKAQRAAEDSDKQYKESQTDLASVVKEKDELVAKFAEAQGAIAKASEEHQAAVTVAVKEKGDLVVKLTETEKKLTEAQTKTAEAEKSSAKTATASSLAKMLSESKLPEIAQARLRERFAEAVTVDGLKEAIAGEQAYLKTLGLPHSVTPKNLGEAHNGSNENERDVQEVTPDRMAEAFALMGLNEREAKLAGRL